VRVGGTDLQNTVAGRQVAGRALELNCAPIDPNRCDDAAIRYPSAGPNAVAHPSATRESNPEERGSSAQGFAARIAAQHLESQSPRARCTRNSRTSYHSDIPSTCHRKRKN
jgi:hypothetical protein